MVEMLVVVGLVTMVASIAVPSLIRARKRAQTGACIENLKQIHAAQQQYLIEAKPDDKNKILKKNLVPYFKGGRFPDCPSGGDYKLGDQDNRPECSLAQSEGHTL